MALNTCEMWFNGIKIAFFSKKLRNIAQRLGASPPDPRLWYVWITIHFFTRHVSQFKHVPILTIGLSPLLERVPSYVPTPGRGLWSSILQYLCPHKKFLFEVSDDVIACDLWFGPPPPSRKFWLRLCPKPLKVGIKHKVRNY